MNFVSGEFIGFLAATIVLYFLFPKKYRFIVLLIANTFFYIFSCGFNFIYLLISIVSVWGAALLMDKFKKHKKLIFILTILLNLGLLIFLKEHNSILGTINKISGNNFSLFDLVVPMGISYYTLVALSYLIEMYLGRAKPFKNFVRVYLAMTFFPLMVEGPIVKVCEVQNELYEGQDFNYNNLKYGYLRMLWGYAKKLVIADRIALVANAVFAGGYGGMTVVLGMVCYAIQIYAEFSGCMDIVLGIAKIFNIPVPENFNVPFASKNVSEFWRRWHITLGRWLKDYIFFPLTMSKFNMKLNLKSHKKLPRFLADVITSFIPLLGVWLLMGIWHGYGWKYIAYGMYWLILIILGMLGKPVFKWIIDKFKVKVDCFSFRLFQIIRTSIFVVIGLSLFRATSISNFFGILGSIWNNTSGSIVDMIGGLPDLYLIIVSVLLLAVVDFVKYKGIKIDEWLEKQNLPFRYIIFLAALFFVLIFGMYGSGYNPSSFIYEGF